MPRNVRNFWIDSRIDGRPSRLTGGPRSKDGGMVTRFLQRDHAAVGDREVTVAQYVSTNGGPVSVLVTRVDFPAGAEVTQHEDGRVTVDFRTVR